MATDFDAWEAPGRPAPPVIGWTDPETGRSKLRYDTEAERPRDPGQEPTTVRIDDLDVEIVFRP